MLFVSIITTEDVDILESEILQLSVINEFGTVLYDKTFRPVYHDTWDTSLATLTPENVRNCPTFHECIPEMQKVFDTDHRIFFWSRIHDLEFNGFDLSDKQFVDLKKGFSDYYRKYVDPNHMHSSGTPRATTPLAAAMALLDRSLNITDDQSTTLDNAKALLVIYQTILLHSEGDERTKKRGWDA